jgi:hypothetical protein
VTVQALLDQCTDYSTTGGSSSNASLERYAALLRAGELAAIFAALSSQQPSATEEEDEPTRDLTRIVTDVVKLPDRTLGVRGGDSYPAALAPAAYCSYLLRSLAAGLLEVGLQYLEFSKTIKKN